MKTSNIFKWYYDLRVITEKDYDLVYRELFTDVYNDNLWLFVIRNASGTYQDREDFDAQLISRIKNDIEVVCEFLSINHKAKWVYIEGFYNWCNITPEALILKLITSNTFMSYLSLIFVLDGSRISAYLLIYFQKYKSEIFAKMNLYENLNFPTIDDDTKITYGYMVSEFVVSFKNI